MSQGAGSRTRTQPQVQVGRQRGQSGRNMSPGGLPQPSEQKTVTDAGRWPHCSQRRRGGRTGSQSQGLPTSRPAVPTRRRRPSRSLGCCWESATRSRSPSSCRPRPKCCCHRRPQLVTGVPTQDIQTEVDIATSPGILNPAASGGGLNLPYSTLQHRVRFRAHRQTWCRSWPRPRTPPRPKLWPTQSPTNSSPICRAQNSALESGAAQEATQRAAQLLQARSANRQETARPLNSRSPRTLRIAEGYERSEAIRPNCQRTLTSLNQDLKAVNTEITQARFEGSASGFETRKSSSPPRQRSNPRSCAFPSSA